MRTLFLASACVVVISTQALACRGTAEYPQALTRLENADLLSERKTELMEHLRRGQAIHEEGHRQGDKGKKEESLRILDEILGQISK
jgi:hypothetical protein